MVLFAKQKQSHRCREQKNGYEVGDEAGGMNWENGIDIYTLLILYISQQGKNPPAMRKTWV